MRAPSCCRALDDPDTCEHKQRYIAAVAYVQNQGFPVSYARSDEKNAWWGGRSLLHFNPREIRIWPTAFEHYGWDIMTSVLIHEFGHCELHKAEGIYIGLEAEIKADEYGSRLMLAMLVPALYRQHRSFFLKTHLQPATKEEFLRAFENWDANST